MNIDRGTAGRTPRLRSLDLESQQDFIRGFRGWVYGDLDKAARARSEAILTHSDVDPGDGSPLDAVQEILHADSLVATRNRCWASGQMLMHRDMIDYFYQEADHYRALIDAPEAGGANEGGLELNPDLAIPDYARHEIHIQPGGYVGEEFAGLLYHHATNSFYTRIGGNESDEQHEGIVANLVEPQDGRVERIVDLGCGIGQLATTMKSRYRDAEVIGIDVAVPMLRYANYRSHALGQPVRFVQGLAEDTGLEGGSADIVTVYLLFHEVPAEIGKAIIAEAFRLLRPGGVFNVVDFSNGGPRPAYDRYTRWVDYKFNNELWSLEFVNSDFRGNLRGAGFVVEGDAGGSGITHYVARKPLAD